MGKPRQEIVDLAIEKLARELLLKKINQGYSKLKKDPKAWQEELEERNEWERINDLKD